MAPSSSRPAKSALLLLTAAAALPLASAFPLHPPHSPSTTVSPAHADFLLEEKPLHTTVLMQMHATPSAGEARGGGVGGRQGGEGPKASSPTHPAEKIAGEAVYYVPGAIPSRVTKESPLADELR